MPVVLGIAGRSPVPGRRCSCDAADPALVDFLADAWDARLESKAVGDTPPGLYPITVRFVYEVLGSQVVRLSVRMVEGSRLPSVEDAFRAALEATGRLGARPSTFTDGLRAVQTTLLLEVPEPEAPPSTAPDAGITALFAEAVRAVFDRLGARGEGAQRIDVEVAPIGDRWQVEAVPGTPTALVDRLRAALHAAGRLAEAPGHATTRVSLWVRSAG